jgi:hypothetical protein
MSQLKEKAIDHVISMQKDVTKNIYAALMIISNFDFAKRAEVEAALKTASEINTDASHWLMAIKQP